MKFRNTETGEVFSDLEEAAEAFCGQYDCLYNPCILWGKTDGRPCFDWIQGHPHEAARLMGYEVVYESGDDAVPLDMLADTFNEIGKEGNMDKPLKDWTLEECKAYCSEKHGAACFNDDEINDCVLEKCGLCCSEPKDMDLLGKPHFTQQEVERAKAIKAIWPNAERIEHPNTSLYVYSGVNFLTKIPESTFPSIQQGQTCNIEDIIDAEKD